MLSMVTTETSRSEAPSPLRRRGVLRGELRREIRRVQRETGVVRMHAVDEVLELVRNERQAVDQVQIRVGRRPLPNDLSDGLPVIAHVETLTVLDVLEARPDRRQAVERSRRLKRANSVEQ